MVMDAGTVFARKGLETAMDEQKKNPPPDRSTQRNEFDKDQPSENAGGPNPRNESKVPPRFDEGGRKPAPIERTSDDGVRSAEPSDSASLGKRPDGERRNTEATMPPGEHQPKRNTM